MPRNANPLVSTTKEGPRTAGEIDVQEPNSLSYALGQPFVGSGSPVAEEKLAHEGTMRKLKDLRKKLATFRTQVEWFAAEAELCELCARELQNCADVHAGPSEISYNPGRRSVGSLVALGSAYLTVLNRVGLGLWEAPGSGASIGFKITETLDGSGLAAWDRLVENAGVPWVRFRNYSSCKPGRCTHLSTLGRSRCPRDMADSRDLQLEQSVAAFHTKYGRPPALDELRKEVRARAECQVFRAGGCPGDPCHPDITSALSVNAAGLRAKLQKDTALSRTLCGLLRRSATARAGPFSTGLATPQRTARDPGIVWCAADLRWCPVIQAALQGA